MSKIKGTVTGCDKGKFSYFVTLDTKDGFYFNTKFEPKCGPGDVVGIEYEQKAENRGNVKKITILEQNSKGYPGDSAKTGGGTPSKGSTGGGYTADPNRQASIVFQSSRKDALEFLSILLAQDAAPVKGKGDAKRVQLEELLDEITVKFFEAAENPRASKAFKTNGEIKDDLRGEPEEDAPEQEEEKEKDEWSSDEWDD